jgi:hypothetical protein
MITAMCWFLFLWFLATLALIFRAVVETMRSNHYTAQLCEMAGEDIDSTDERLSEYAWLIRASIDDKDKLWPSPYVR